MTDDQRADDELAFIASGGIRQQNFWDSAAFFDSHYGSLLNVRLFGNSNIGMLERCNLQSPGQVCYEGSFVLRRWYARTNACEPEMAAALRAWSHSSYATFHLGDRLMWTLPFVELFARRPTAEASEIQPRRLHDPWPIIVPTRQNISVGIDTFSGTSDALSAFYSQNAHRGAGRVWVHLEGVWLRHDDRSPRWREVLRALMGLEESAVAVEQEVADWIRGQRVPGADDANAQLEAIADAVLEGRARR